MELIGDGPLHEELLKNAADWGLDSNLCFSPFMKPDEVREKMEGADIFLLTSDYKEGWGAVAGEAMNSGCLLIANAAAGASRFLVRHGINGFLYKNGDVSSAFHFTKKALQNKDKTKEMAARGYQSILAEWNPEEAADRLFKACEAICSGAPLPHYATGPLSAAEIIKPGFFNER